MSPVRALDRLGAVIMTIVVGTLIGAIAGVVVLACLAWIFGFLLTTGIAVGGVLLPARRPRRPALRLVSTRFGRAALHH
jgi:hypothetical protein